MIQFFKVRAGSRYRCKYKTGYFVHRQALLQTCSDFLLDLLSLVHDLLQNMDNRCSWLVFVALGVLGLLTVGNAGSGELQQLYTYVNRTTLLSVEQYFNETSGCISRFLAQQLERGSPPRYCRKIAEKAEVLKRFGQLPNLSKNSDECVYSLKKRPAHAHFVDVGHENVLISVALMQTRCAGEHKDEGASLRVTLQNGSHYCALRHIRGPEQVYGCSINTTVSSQIKIKGIKSSCNALCNVTVTATLDFEHYGAYHERESQNYGRNKVVLHRTIDSVRLTSANGKRDKSVLFTRVPVCCNMEPYDMGRAIQADHTKMGKDLEGRRAGGAVITKTLHRPALGASGSTTKFGKDITSYAAVRERFSQYASVYFVGTSHMRYLWDAIAVRYFNGSEVLQQHPQHHRDLAAGNTWFVNVYFTMELPAIVREICASGSVYAPSNATHADQPVMFVFQAGSWDLDYNPVRNLVFYPNSSTVVVDTVRRLASPGSNCHGHPVKVLWLTDMPVPECDPTSTAPPPPVTIGDAGTVHQEKSSCFDKGYRNNYAIAAGNQFFTAALTNKGHGPTTGGGRSAGRRESKPGQTKSPGNGGFYSRLMGMLSGKIDNTAADPAGGPQPAQKAALSVLDANTIVYPHRQHHVCGLHYLCCKHAPKTNQVDILVTPGGQRLLDIVLAVLLQ